MSIHLLREFVVGMRRLTEKAGAADRELLTASRPLMSDLIRSDNWLPRSLSSIPRVLRPPRAFLDRQLRLGTGSGNAHTGPRDMGLIGILDGAELSQRYEEQDDLWPPAGGETLMEPGDIDCVSPLIGDVHKARNPQKEKSTISIHMYGGNIGKINCHEFDQVTGHANSFVSGY